jgi:predicted DNA-binding protein with PD1-like motif
MPVLDCLKKRRKHLTMKYSEARQGRIFVIRLEDGEIVHQAIEQFARDHSIKAAVMTIVGGVDTGSKLVVGPTEGRSKPIVPMEHVLDNVHEITGVGTLFPDEQGNPMLHMHTAAGRKTSTVTGCVRTGIKTWHILEVVLIELLDTKASRVFDAETGLKLLTP